MKLQTRARYALRMMVVVAREASDGQAVSLGRVAEATMISRRYLEQVVAGLRRDALVRSRSGRRGGYQLARPAEDITVREIVEAAIGPISIVTCVLRPEQCLKADLCECRWVYQLINQGICNVLDSLTLEDMTDRPWVQQVCAQFEPNGSGCPQSTGAPAPSVAE